MENLSWLNDKLVNRFEKYFLRLYCTLLVVISSLVSVIFNKKQLSKKLLVD